MKAVMTLILALIWTVQVHGQELVAPPALPFSPYGIVSVDGEHVPDGTVVEALCGGTVYRRTLTQTYLDASWYFNLDIPGDDPETATIKEGCSAAEVVYFHIGGLLADQTAAWVSGKSSQLNLSRSSIWDKSTLSLTGRCLSDGSAEFTVVNGGNDMAGPVEWRLSGTPTVMGGVFQLAAGASQTWTFGPYSYAVDFAIKQRPGHPGLGVPHLALDCRPTALRLTSFTARRLWWWR